MKQQNFPNRPDNARALLSNAMGLGRVLGAKIRAAAGIIAPRHTAVLDAVARPAAERRLLDDGVHVSIDRLIALLDREIEVASEDQIEEFIASFDGEDCCHGTRTIRAVASHAEPLVEIRNRELRSLRQPGAPPGIPPSRAAKRGPVNLDFTTERRFAGLGHHRFAQPGGNADRWCRPPEVVPFNAEGPAGLPKGVV